MLEYILGLFGYSTLHLTIHNEITAGWPVDMVQQPTLTISFGRSSNQSYDQSSDLECFHIEAPRA